jgi:hypothetical protein
MATSVRTASIRAVLLAVALTAAAAIPAAADDLTGINRILCTSVQVTVCTESGDCVIDLPWNVNVPQFIEIDLASKRMNTTKASGENRSTAIEHLRRENGAIVLQGFERGRAFSFVITEATGALSVAVAAEDKAVAVFGACTPMSSAR